MLGKDKNKNVTMYFSDINLQLRKLHTAIPFKDISAMKDERNRNLQKKKKPMVMETTQGTQNLGGLNRIIMVCSMLDYFDGPFQCI